MPNPRFRTGVGHNDTTKDERTQINIQKQEDARSGGYQACSMRISYDIGIDGKNNSSIALLFFIDPYGIDLVWKKNT